MVTKANNIVSIKSNSKTALDIALDKMEAFGRELKDLSGKSTNVRYRAAIYYGEQVKEGLATLEQAKDFVTRYMTGADGALIGPAYNVVVSQFRAYAGTAQPRAKELEKVIADHMKGKTNKELNGKDMFAAAYRVNAKINALTKDGKKIPALAKLVADVCKPEPKKAKVSADPKKAQVDLIADAIESLKESAEVLLAGKLSPKKKELIEALLKIKW